MTKRDYDLPIEVGLRDGLFTHAKGFGFGGDALDEEPYFLSWNREERLPVMVYTDTCLDQVEQQDWKSKKVALLIESPPFRTKHYHYAIENTRRFDHVLSFHKKLILEMNDHRWQWYPRGGTFVAEDDWERSHAKHPEMVVSFLASDKSGATGHDFRHDVFSAFGDAVDVFGPMAGGEITGKLEAVAPYLYTIVIEGERLRGGFSDHLLDCFALGTVPIYWQELDIDQYFDTRGMLCFEDLDDLGRILSDIVGVEDFMIRKESDILDFNRMRALRYRCPEDWIVRNIPEVLLP